MKFSEEITTMVCLLQPETYIEFDRMVGTSSSGAPIILSRVERVIDVHYTPRGLVRLISSLGSIIYRHPNENIIQYIPTSKETEMSETKIYSEEEWFDIVSDLLEENFPKGVSQERGQALVVIAKLKTDMSKRGLVVNNG